MSLSPGLLTLCLNHKSIISIYFKDVFVLLLLLLISLFQQMPYLTDEGKVFHLQIFSPLSCMLQCKGLFWGKNAKNRCNQMLGEFTRTKFHFWNMHSMWYFITYSHWKPSVQQTVCRNGAGRSINTDKSWKTLNSQPFLYWFPEICCLVCAYVTTY